MSRMYVDTETFSTTDIKKAGTVKYAKDCEMLLARFKLGDQAFTWETGNEGFPLWVWDHVRCGKPVVAHNALFDFLVLEPFFGGELTLKQMQCTQAKVQSHGLPASLEKACEALGAPQDRKKSLKGKSLIRKFCIPRKPSKLQSHTRVTPEMAPKEWEVFRDEYLYQDVEALEWLDKQLPDLSPTEHEVWAQTQRMNLRGIPVDTDSIAHIADAIDHAVDKYASNFIRRTCLFPTQIEKIIQWINNNGVICSDLTVDTVNRIIADDNTPGHVREALITRQNVSHAAFKKYPAMLAATMPDQTVKGCFAYHAAHTGRFGGRLIQPHNFTRGSINAIKAVEEIKAGNYSVELVKSAVRGMVYHANGFTIADYNAIEARTLAWLAGEQDALDVFINGQDPYRWMAQYIYEVEYDDVTAEQRFVGKQAVLGLGYQMGHMKFKAQAEKFGVEIAPEVAIKAVMVYRRTHDRIVNLWSTLQYAAKMALERPGRRIKANKYISFERPPSSLFLYMHLPSGRRIAYPYPEIRDASFSHMHVSLGQWKRVDTYGGRLVENAVQAIARDIMCEALQEMRHLDVVMHIHDETVTVGDHRTEVTGIMEYVPEWAEGLPLKVEAKYAERFYKA